MTEIAVSLLLGLLDRAAQIGTLISTAKAQGRDVTAAELDALVAADQTARGALQQAIDAAQAKSAA